MICVIEDNNQIISCLKNHDIIFALYDFVGFTESHINMFSIFIINSKRQKSNGSPCLSLIKLIKKVPFKRIIVVGDIDERMKHYYKELGVDSTTSLSDLCPIVKENIALVRKFKYLQKTSESFKEQTTIQTKELFQYNNLIISQIKEIFIKYFPLDGEKLLKNCIEKNYDYKRILQEAYSLLSDSDKKIFMDDIKKISIQ